MDRQVNIFSLEGRVAILTGVLGKLGPIWAKALMGSGAKVIGIDRVREKSDKLIALMKRLYPLNFFYEKGDICRSSDLMRIRAKVRSKFGKILIVVNNAGIDLPPSASNPSQYFENIPMAQVQKVLEINFMGAFRVLQVFGPDLIKSGNGAVVNIGSMYSMVSPDQRLYEHIPLKPPFLKPPAYGASKAALVNLTKFLATLWGPKGVRVNTLSPGGVEGNQDPTFKGKFNSRVPLGRMATAEDLSGPLLFLASDASRYVTGINLAVDGGFTAW